MAKRGKTPSTDGNTDKQLEEIFRLKSIIDDLPGDVYWKDLDGVYLGMNETGRKSLQRMGFLPIGCEILGKTDYDLFDEETADEFRKNDLTIIKSGLEKTREEKALLNSGEEIIQLSTKRPLRDEYGNIVGIVGNTVDITYLKKIESDLRAAKEEAEALSRAKTDFLRNMEHDIRTPFSGIYSISDFLTRQEQDEQKKELLETISLAAKELLDYCNGIVDFSRLESGKWPVVSKKFDLKKLVDKVIIIESPPAKAKELKLLTDIHHDIPTILIGDPERIQRILINLISNAIKFTPKGFVKVSVSIAKQLDEKNIILRAAVQDTGIGIPQDKQAYIYEKFSRLTPSNKGAYGGSGLGLGIVKRLVAELDGEIDLSSSQDKGTLFICTIPFKLPLVSEVLFERT